MNIFVNFVNTRTNKIGGASYMAKNKDTKKNKNNNSKNPNTNPNTNNNQENK